MNRKVEFCSHVGNLSLVRNFVRQFLGQHGCDEGETTLLVLGIDEACTNVIRHAYGNRQDQLICLQLESLGAGGRRGGVRFRLRDYAGAPADPAAFRGRQLEEVRPGGLGLHFIHRVFDHVRYLPKPNGTELVLTKRFNPSASPAPAGPEPRSPRPAPSRTASAGGPDA